MSTSGGSAAPAGKREGAVRWRAYRAFAASTSSVPRVRRWVRECLVRAGIEPDVRARAELLVSELVTNAIQHARGLRVMVSVQTDDHVEAAVRDDDASPPLPRRADAWETGGRGLALVDALADAWGSRPAVVGKWVWFRVDRGAE
jgi:anti-sigma regulatory factor (Ser/Thr protein kinase)